MSKITEHRFAHLSEKNMHEVKGFPSSAVNFAYKKNTKGISEWQRVARQENVLDRRNGFEAPITEIDGDVYIIEAPELDVNGLVWQSGTTVRVTFSAGYSNIYEVDNYLQINGEANAKHNGVFLITGKSATYLDVINVNIIDGVDDVIEGSVAIAYVTHQNFDPENLANNQSIPRIGMVRYFSDVDLWFGDSLIKGDEWYNEANDSVEFFNGTTIAKGFKEYRASLNQSDADPIPTGEVGLLSVTHTRVAAGRYLIRKESNWAAGTSVNINCFGFVKIAGIIANEITYKTYPATTPTTAADGVLINASIIITEP